MGKRLRAVSIAVILTLLVIWVGGNAVGLHLMLKPRPSHVDAQNSIGGKNVEEADTRASDGVALSAWLLRSDPEHVVVLLNGMGGDRRGCIPKAKYYSGQGYSVLLPDLRATGESGGALITLGWQERLDLAAWRDWLRAQGYTHIGAAGASLGAATICYATTEIDDFAFIVLESGFDRIDTAFGNHIARMGIHPLLAAPARLMLHWRTGVRLDPVDCLKDCSAPTLVIAGDSDEFVKVSETESLYQSCGAGLKRLVLFPGGKHECLLNGYPEQYELTLGSFLAELPERPSPSQ